MLRWSTLSPCICQCWSGRTAYSLFSTKDHCHAVHQVQRLPLPIPHNIEPVLDIQAVCLFDSSARTKPIDAVTMSEGCISVQDGTAHTICQKKATSKRNLNNAFAIVAIVVPFAIETTVSTMFITCLIGHVCRWSSEETTESYIIIAAPRNKHKVHAGGRRCLLQHQRARSLALISIHT